MLKVFAGIAVAGFFVGAFGTEMIKRWRPDLAKRIEEKAKQTADVLVDGFKKGYESTKSQTKEKD